MKTVNAFYLVIVILFGTTSFGFGQMAECSSSLENSTQIFTSSSPFDRSPNYSEFIEIPAISFGYLYPEQTYTYFIYIVNHGPISFDSLYGRFVSFNPYLTINDPVSYLGGIDPGSSKLLYVPVFVSEWLYENMTFYNDFNVFSKWGKHGEAGYWNSIPFYYDCASTQIEDEYIARVEFGSIDNSSGWQGGVADYTDLYTILYPGDTHNILVTNGNAWANDQVRCWVDWDRMDCFCDETPYILTNINGTGEFFSGEIFVPEAQGWGPYRMRIRMTFNSPPLPGGDATYGEIEDYTLIVGDFDSVATPHSLQYMMPYDDLYLTWKTPKAFNVLKYKVYRNDFPVSDWQKPTTFCDPDLSPGTYLYTVSALYPTGESEKSEPLQVVIGDEKTNNRKIDFSGVTTLNQHKAIYPNPAKDFLTIEYDNLQRVEIFDLSGNMIISQNSRFDKPLSIDVKGIKSGVYLLNCISDTEIFSHKIIIKH